MRERVVAIIDDPRVEVRFKFPPREASPISPSDGEAFALIQRSIAEIFPDVIVAPFLTIGGTDAREYAPVTDGLYRFAPFVYGPEDLKLPHGIDERIAVAGLPGAVRFYEQLVANAVAVDQAIQSNQTPQTSPTRNTAERAASMFASRGSGAGCASPRKTSERFAAVELRAASGFARCSTTWTAVKKPSASQAFIWAPNARWRPRLRAFMAWTRGCLLSSDPNCCILK